MKENDPSLEIAPLERLNLAASSAGGGGLLTNAHPEMASFGPGRRSIPLEILAVAQLRLRFPNRCGLGRNQNLPFLDGH
jgi:hypothetical protein